MSIRYAQLQPFTLAGSGSSIGDTTLTLQTFNDIDGNALSMSDFGSKGYGTLEPGNQTQEEQISFTGVTTNSDGTVTLTGVSNVAFVYPYTETSGLTKLHAGGVRFVVSNTSGFYGTFANKKDDETIEGAWQFQNTAVPTYNTHPTFTINTQIVDKKYVDDVAISGAPDADTVTKGIVQIATGAQLAAGTNTGTTGAVIVPGGGSFKNSSSGAGDVNKIPVLNSSGVLDSSFYSTIPIAKGGTGQTAKTAAFDALSPTTTKGDLIANNGTNNVRQAVGTNGQVLLSDSTQSTGVKWSSTAPGIISRTFGVLTGDGSSSQTIAHGLGVKPSYVSLNSTVAFSTGGGNTEASGSWGASNGTLNSCSWATFADVSNISNQAGADASNCIHLRLNGSNITATVTLDATNITINWSTFSLTNSFVQWTAFM